MKGLFLVTVLFSSSAFSMTNPACVSQCQRSYLSTVSSCGLASSVPASNQCLSYARSTLNQCQEGCYEVVYPTPTEENSGDN